MSKIVEHGVQKIEDVPKFHGKVNVRWCSECKQAIAQEKNTA